MSVSDLIDGPRFAVAVGLGVRDRFPKQIYVTFRELASTVLKPQTLNDRGEKTRLGWFIAGETIGRHVEDMETRSMIVLDVESQLLHTGAKPDALTIYETMREIGVRGWVYPTLNDRDTDPRTRIVLPLAEPLKRNGRTAQEFQDEYAAHVWAAVDCLGIARTMVDPSCAEVSRLMFVPARAGEKEPLPQVLTQKRGRPWRPTAQMAPSARSDSALQPPEKKLADMPDGKHDAVLQALRSAGMYIRSGKEGQHFIRCPHYAEHGVQGGDSQTAYYEPHFNGFVTRGVKCQDTQSPEHLTISGLVQGLREDGYLADEVGPVAVESADESPDVFFKRTAVANMLDINPPPLEFAIPGFAPMGMVSILAGKGGVSKSSLALRLVIAVATGTPFGPFNCRKPMKCLYVTYEDDERTLPARLQAMVNSLEPELDSCPSERIGRTPAAMNRLVRQNVFIEAVAGKSESWMLAGKPDRFGGPKPTERIAWLRAALSRGGIRLLILDPASFTHRLEESDPGEMAAFMQMLGGLAAESNCAILLLHHMPKYATANGIDSVDQDSIRGASSWSDNARSVMVMVSLPRKDAPRFNLPDDDETPKKFVVIKHVKHNHSAALGGGEGVFVFERQHALLIPRLEIVRCAAAELNAMKERRKAGAADLDAMSIARFLAARQGTPTTMTTLRTEVCNKILTRYQDAIQVAVDMKWARDEGTGKRNQWVVTPEGLAALADWKPQPITPVKKQVIQVIPR